MDQFCPMRLVDVWEGECVRKNEMGPVYEPEKGEWGKERRGV